VMESLGGIEGDKGNKGNWGVEVIYIDNGSTDGTLNEMQRYTDAKMQRKIVFRIIKSRENLGFTKANNLGAKNAGGKYLLFLNSDTEIIDGALGKMVDYLEKHPDIGVLGPKLYDSKKMDLQVSSTGKLTPLTAIFSLSAINKYFPNNFFSKKYFISDWSRESTKEVENVSGAAMMMSKKIFEQIGGFDERYFIYFEETDLCMAVKKLGKKIVYYPKAGIIHYGGKTTVKMAYKMKNIFLASRFRFFRKHYGFISALMTESILRFMEFFSK